MKFYQYPKCSTCVKAQKFLDANGAEYESTNIVDQPPTKQELETMLNVYNGNIRKLFNTSGMQYRELNLKDKIPSMSAEQAVDLLASNGMLVKRPFLLINGDGIVGFKEELWASLLDK